jgi:hypothetical protein
VGPDRDLRGSSPPALSAASGKFRGGQRWAPGRCDRTVTAVTSPQASEWSR